MNKDQALDEFFRSLRVTLTNAFSYPKDHPYFLKSAQNFRNALQEVQEQLVPFVIGVTDEGLVVNSQKVTTRAGFHDELARLLHQRKIKSLEVRNIPTLEEIVSLFSIISLSPKEIIKKGGVSALLEKEGVSDFIVEELDYSLLLQENGKECADLWGYIFRHAQSGDPSRLNGIVENFGSLIKSAGHEQVLPDNDSSFNIGGFLSSLKDKNKEQFNKCSKDLFLWLLRNKKSLTREKVEKLKVIFNSLNREDMDALFWEGLLQEDNFDVLSLELFSKISEQKEPHKMGQNLLNKVKAQPAGNPKVIKTVKNLLTGITGGNLSAVYRHTLETLVQGISASGVLVFDQKSLKDNYRYILLNILYTEEDKEHLQLAAESLEKELPSLIHENDLLFLKDLWTMLKDKQPQEGPLAELEKKLSAFIEEIILKEDLPPEKEFFLEMVTMPYQGAGVYLDRIFNAASPNKNILRLFFKFYSGNLDFFYTRVQQKITDLEFLAALIEALGQLSPPETIGILDHIYSSANELIKLEILNIMRRLKKVDVQFLLRQLNTESPVLRKNLLSVLILDAQGTEGALELLFNVPNFMGRNNGLLIENMQMAFELGLLEAGAKINELSHRRFFWNRALRKKANQILKEWDAK